VAYHRLALLTLCVPLLAQQYTISTLASNFYNPESLAIDSAGDLYVLDWSGYLRKIWLPTGAITIVAGTGTEGFSGDGGPATNARIARGAIALDPAQNIYLADPTHNRIRRIDATTGIITTVAGTGAPADSGDNGPATAAGVSQPSGIALDAAGNLYFSSSWSRVRKVDASTGMIQTIAGRDTTAFAGDNGPATDALFWDPIPSLIDPKGNLYLADFENSRIRVVSGSDGTVTTIAGSSPCGSGTPYFTGVCQGGFAGDGGPAQNALLNYAEGIARDREGNLFIADTINRRIRCVDAESSVILTIAGSGTEGFSGDDGPALAAKLGTPVGVAVDRSGKIYFADEENNRVRVLTPVTPYPCQVRRPPRRLSVK